MKLSETPVVGVLLIEAEPVEDERGAFTKVFDREVLLGRGLEAEVAQAAQSRNARAGTLRGMHYQAEPHGECKLVHCTRGAIYDVALDLRPSSPTFRAWHAVELAEEDELALYVPRGVAQGFQTLSDASEVSYFISAPYVAELQRGARYDDPAFGIEWPPAAERTVSERDLSFPDFPS